jgi:hypothetical protein
MNPPLDAATDDRIEIAKTFAQQFNHFEWEYLCSYQWFLTGIDRALETGNFAQLSARAEKTLIDDRIRLQSEVKTDSKHFASWLG